MDWTVIITTLLASLIPTGGFATMFTIREKKTEMILDNMAKIINQWKELANEQKLQMTSMQEDIRAKDEKIDEQHREKSAMRHELDDAHTEVAISKLVYCKKFATCPEKDPPFAADALEVLNRIEHPISHDAKKRVSKKEEVSNAIK